jgi:branched-chain amino acid transport system permease protein
MEYFLNQLINAIGVGAIYALVALGYTMVYGIVKLINFAHGDIIMVGSYFVLILTQSFGAPFWLAVLISMGACAVIGVVIEKIAYKPLREAPRIVPLITAIGVSIFLQNLFAVIFKPDARPFTAPIVGSVAFGEIKIANAVLMNIIASGTIMILLTLFVKFTRVGKAMRAVSEDSGAASLLGINVNATISVTFAIGTALAALGGALYSATYPMVNPFMGSMFGLKAFIAAVFGGIGIIPGAVLGGFIMGFAETFTKASVAISNYSDTVVFSILIFILVLKPSGVLGKNIKEKV